MSKSDRTRTILASVTAGAATAALLAGANYLAARRAERKHPPKGSFVVVDGVKLHYSDRGTGSPVVLIHGNAVTGADWNTSGVADRLLSQHRVIIFDRPGFGYSERPRGRLWTASRQAELLHQAIRQLGVEKPIVVGHSWGAIVALAMAVQHQAELAGAVLVSGYYHWTLRPDVVLVTIGALPGIGDLLRYTVSPLLGWLQMPLLKWQMFSPAPVPARFQDEYSTGMALRPSQIRATSEDGALMIPGVLAMRESYGDLKLPVTIIAGASDRVVFKERSEQLADDIPGSILQVVEGAGHMVHHFEPARVVAAVDRMAMLSDGSLRPRSSRSQSLGKVDELIE